MEERVACGAIAALRLVVEKLIAGGNHVVGKRLNIFEGGDPLRDFDDREADLQSIALARMELFAQSIAQPIELPKIVVTVAHAQVYTTKVLSGLGFFKADGANCTKLRTWVRVW